VAHLRNLLEGLGHTLATPAEARAALALKGPDEVSF